MQNRLIDDQMCNIYMLKSSKKRRKSGPRSFEMLLLTLEKHIVGIEMLFNSEINNFLHFFRRLCIMLLPETSITAVEIGVNQVQRSVN